MNLGGRDLQWNESISILVLAMAGKIATPVGVA